MSIAPPTITSTDITANSPQVPIRVTFQTPSQPVFTNRRINPAVTTTTTSAASTVLSRVNTHAGVTGLGGGGGVTTGGGITGGNTGGAPESVG